jgi:hypothetical protein
MVRLSGIAAPQRVRAAESPRRRFDGGAGTKPPHLTIPITGHGSGDRAATSGGTSTAAWGSAREVKDSHVFLAFLVMGVFVIIIVQTVKLEKLPAV